LIRAILDTHIFLEYLLWDSPKLAILREMYARREIMFALDQACHDEWALVLGYPQFALDDSRRSELIAAQRALCAWHTLAEVPNSEIPRCKDPNDQKFLSLLVHSESNFLVTRDKKLRKVGRHRFFKQRNQRILTLEDFIASFVLAPGST
jgi:uncharacterized protein